MMGGVTRSSKATSEIMRLEEDDWHENGLSMGKVGVHPPKWGVRGLSGFDKQTAAVEILKITVVLGPLKRIGEKVLDFLDLLQSVVDLEALYILDNPGHLVIFAEIDQLLLSRQG